MTREEVLYAIRTSACRGSDTKEWVYTEKDLMQSFDDLYFNNPEYNDNSAIEDIKAEIRQWYWQADKQEIAKDPCVVDAMVDLFIRTINKHISGKENDEQS